MPETRHEFFTRRVQELGAGDADADYGGMLGESVLALSELFAKQRHSGASADITVQLFNQLFNDWNDPNVRKR